MANPYLGEIRIFSFNYAPTGWLMCNGQTLAISSYAALFSLLGTTYGGNGTTNFQLPNLQGRMPMHFGNGIVQGQLGGETAHVLTPSETPIHTHQALGSSTPANLGVPTGNLWASGNAAYAPTTNTSMSPSCLTSFGGGLSHDNMPPYLTLNFCIAMAGIFPSRS